MKRFIEFTEYDSKRPILINLDSVESIKPACVYEKGSFICDFDHNSCIRFKSGGTYCVMTPYTNLRSLLEKEEE